MTVDDLLSKLGGKLEEINFLEIQNYLRKSKAWRNTSFAFQYLPMIIASKENHDVHSKGESGVREKRSATMDSILVLHPTKWLTGTPDYSEMGTPPLYAVQEFIAALAAATDGKRTLPSLKTMQGKLRSWQTAASFLLTIHLASKVHLKSRSNTSP